MTSAQADHSPSAEPVAEESARRWSEGYVAIEYEAMELLEGVKHPARSLWLAARIWSSRKATDGVIPVDKLRSVGASAGLTMRGAPAAAAELVKVGLWRRVNDESWCDSTFLLHNVSRLTREHRRDVARLKKDRQRANRGAAYSNDADVPQGQDGGQDGGHSDSNVTKSNLEQLNVVGAREQSPPAQGEAFTSHEDDAAGVTASVVGGSSDVDGNGAVERQLSPEGKATAKAIMEKVEAMKARSSSSSQDKAISQ
jgi:hypothetical protein